MLIMYLVSLSKQDMTIDLRSNVDDKCVSRFATPRFANFGQSSLILFFPWLRMAFFEFASTQKQVSGAQCRNHSAWYPQWRSNCSNRKPPGIWSTAVSDATQDKTKSEKCHRRLQLQYYKSYMRCHKSTNRHRRDRAVTWVCWRRRVPKSHQAAS